MEIIHYRLYQFLEKIRPYVKNVINSLKESGEWKTRLSFKVVFRSSKDVDENCIINFGAITKIMINEEIDKIMEQVFKSLLTI